MLGRRYARLGIQTNKRKEDREDLLWLFADWLGTGVCEMVPAATIKAAAIVPRGIEAGCPVAHVGAEVEVTGWVVRRSRLQHSRGQCGQRI